MPTATTTATKTFSSMSSSASSLPYTPKIPFKVPQKPKSVPATLQALYNRAARAFLLRDIPLTYSLLNDAFSLLHPPPLSSTYALSPATLDSLSDSRRKWDILRITVESTVYTTPPANQDPKLPDGLKALLSESSHHLITNAYQRSLRLFTPGADDSVKPNASNLPSPVLVTLVNASLRTDCPDVGRLMIEEWLARRDISAFHGDIRPDALGEGDGYDKVLELYCLQILPRLGQLDYAEEFLSYESELLPNIREKLKANLQSLISQQREILLGSHRSLSMLDTNTSMASESASRSDSPSSISSSSSQHTIVPQTSRGNRSGPNGLHALTAFPPPSSSSSTSSLPFTPSHLSSRRSSISSDSASTVTAKPLLQRQHPNGHSHSQSPEPNIPRPPITSRGRPNPNPVRRTQSPTNGSASLSVPGSPKTLNGKRTARSGSSTTLGSIPNESRSASRMGSSGRVPFSMQLHQQQAVNNEGAIRGVGMTTYEVLRSLIRSYLTTKKLTSLVVVLVVIPIVSWLLRHGRGGGLGRKGKEVDAKSTLTNAELVRRRLRTANTELGAVRKVWGELVKMVLDTVKMGGSGLV